MRALWGLEGRSSSPPRGGGPMVWNARSRVSRQLALTLTCQERGESYTDAPAVLREEMEISMRLMGVKNIQELGPQYLETSRL